ncbi:MAG TPA: NifB/NifX family molybdenum-iron cluster-binding protein [Syntrophobacteria bacterium]|nr:NifB/NifX family molybdenum-iron cluster-binding protein [Syntrophobacteria bacterium]
MIIAVTAQGRDLQAEVDPRFGRSRWFLLVDSSSMKFTVVENRQSLALPQGAGIQAARTLADHPVDVLLTGNCGPKAFTTLEAAGINVVVGVEGTIEAAVKDYLEGKLDHALAANVEGHWV